MNDADFFSQFCVCVCACIVASLHISGTYCFIHICQVPTETIWWNEINYL